MKLPFTPILLSACRFAPVASPGSRKVSSALAQVMARRLRLLMVPRAALVLVGAWAAYSLAMLGYLAYDAAWAATLCGVR